MFDEIISFIRDTCRQKNGSIPLHAPTFSGREKEYLTACIDDGFVSSVGPAVERFERAVADYTGAAHAVATVNGTAALHVALLVAGVRPGDAVITQAVSFVATANAIAYCGARPIFLDSDRRRLGLSPAALEEFLGEHCRLGDDGRTYHRASGRRVAACLPMHTFGHPQDLDGLQALCDPHGIELVEDAAEALGSFYGRRHAGTVGRLGVLSFNGNKTITTGGGGMILTNDAALAAEARHLTTTAKREHRWQYHHDRLGFNYRLPAINAALGLAQMEVLEQLLAKKRARAAAYRDFFDALGLGWVQEPDGCRSNYWLGAVLMADREQRDAFLAHSNARGVTTRPLWGLLHRAPMYADCVTDSLADSRWLEERLVNIPSGVNL